MPVIVDLDLQFVIRIREAPNQHSWLRNYAAGRLLRGGDLPANCEKSLASKEASYS